MLHTPHERLSFATINNFELWWLNPNVLGCWREALLTSLVNQALKVTKALSQQKLPVTRCWERTTAKLIPTLKSSCLGVTLTASAHISLKQVRDSTLFKPQEGWEVPSSHVPSSEKTGNICAKHKGSNKITYFHHELIM